MIKKFFSSRKVFNILILITLILAAAYLICNYNFSNKKLQTASVFNISNKDKIIHDDLNGDSKKETITIKNSPDGITAQVNFARDKTYPLNCNEKLGTLGEYTPYWPTRVSTIDISRDNSKEIIFQGSYHNQAVQHIFLWNGDGYSNILASNNNLVGIMDSHNSKTPKIFSGVFSKGKVGFSSYVCNKGSLKEYGCDPNQAIPGLDTAGNFICLIESFPNMYLSVPNYIYPQISGNDLETLFRLANNNNYYIFQDGYFTDSAWDKEGKATCENWILNFRSINVGDDNKVSNVTIEIALNKYDDEEFPYKITSINVY